MKNLFLISAIALMASCNTATTEAPKEAAAAASSYGEKFDGAGALTASELAAKVMAEKTFEGNVTGAMNAICKKAGCWAKLETSDGKSLMVMFRNADGSEFTIDKEAIGKTLIAHGRGYLDTTTVEDLKHYAHDDGKSEEEIAKITEPEIEVVFKASGVTVN